MQKLADASDGRIVVWEKYCMETNGVMSLKAESRTQLLAKLRSIDVVGPLLNEGMRSEYMEAYAAAHFFSSVGNADGLLVFPLELIHRRLNGGKPDFLLSMNGKKIGIEHTEARPENETRKDILRKKDGIGPSVYFITAAEPGEPKRRAEELRREIEANDPKEGWGDQDKTDTKWAEVMMFFIEGKEKKLQSPDFSRYDEDWLLIRDAWPFPSVNRGNATQCLFSQIRNRKSVLQFHRVFVISYECEGPICEITRTGFHLHPRNDLWLTRAPRRRLGTES